MADSGRMQVLGGLTGALLAAVVLRGYHASKVFRGEDIVLIQRDPYLYQFKIERLTSHADGVFDVTAFVDPGRDDLFLAWVGWIAELFGGGPRPVGMLLATYPVVVALAMVVLAFLAAWRLTDEPWFGVFGALALAVTPAHAFRTTLGYGDHHAFDYLLLGVTFVLILGVIGSEGRSVRQRWGLATGLGLALAAQTLAWVGGVLLVVPFVCFAVLVVVSTMRTGESPVETATPLLAAMGIAIVVCTGVVAGLSWQSPTRPLILAAPIPLLLGVAVLGELGHRREWPPAHTLSLALFGGAVAGLIAWTQLPPLSNTLSRGVRYFVRTRGTVTEATSLLADGPVGTTLSLFGLLVIIFVPTVLWITWRGVINHRPRYVALAVYAWYFILLSVEQRRFAGELSFFLAVGTAVGGLAIVQRWGSLRWLPGQGPGADTDVGPTRIPLGTVFIGTLIGTVLIVGSAAMIPPTMDDRVVTDAEYHTAKQIQASAADDRRGGGTYVFSPEIPNPMFNYFAGNEEVDPTYAARQYPRFALSRDGIAWYDRLAEKDTGYLVTSHRYRVTGDRSLHARLHQRLGSGGPSTAGLGQYQLISRSPGGTSTLFRPVPGALVGGTTAPNGSVRLWIEMPVNGTDRKYTRHLTATDAGTFGAIVPYPGQYTIESPTGTSSITVTESAVEAGKSVHERASNAEWSFDQTGGNGQLALDSRGGNHGIIRNGTLPTDNNQTGLTLHGDGLVEVRDVEPFTELENATVSVRFRTDPGTDYRDDRPYPRLVATAEAGRYNRTEGLVIALSRGSLIAALGDGHSATRLRGPRVDDGDWHRTTLIVNRSRCGLLVDGQLHDSVPCDGLPEMTESLVIGASTDRNRHFVGSIDVVSICDRAIGLPVDGQTPAKSEPTPC